MLNNYSDSPYQKLLRHVTTIGRLCGPKDLIGGAPQYSTQDAEAQFWYTQKNTAVIRFQKMHCNMQIRRIMVKLALRPCKHNGNIMLPYEHRN